MGIQCIPFVTAIHCHEVQFLSPCFSETNDPLDLIFVPCFVHTMHIMLLENCLHINSLD